jgi:hypothetical protein
MNWWQTPYNPPPYGWPPQQIPCPPGVDPIKVMEFMDRVQRRAQKAKEKDKDPKKDEKKPSPWKDALWYFQAACILYFLSPPLAALQHIISTIVTQVMK